MAENLPTATEMIAADTERGRPIGEALANADLRIMVDVLKHQNAALCEALEGLLREDEAVGSYTIALSDARKKARAALEEARRS